MTGMPMLQGQMQGNQVRAHGDIPLLMMNQQMPGTMPMLMMPQQGAQQSR